MCFSGIRPDLNPEDKVVKRKLVKCLPRAYSELIRSNIPRSLGSRSSHLATLRPSPSSVMKFSHDGPPVVNPTKGELLARVEMLSRKSRSVKRKAPDSLEKGRSTWGKVSRLGTSSSSPSTHVRVQGQVLPPPSEVPRAPSSQLRSGYVAKAKESSGGGGGGGGGCAAAESPLEVMPITVWSPPAQSAEPPPSRAKELGRKRPEADGDGDSLLLNAELTAGAVSSILKDYDLKRSGALLVEEALALSLQGVASVSSRVFLCLLLNEGSLKAARAYKARVAALTSEQAELRNRMQSMTEEVVKLRSDLRHTTTARARGEGREEKARDGLRAADGELREVRDGLQAAQDDLLVARDGLQAAQTKL